MYSSFQQYLEHWQVSQEWSTWNEGKSFEEFYAACKRGDWLIRLFQICNCHPYRPNYEADLRLLTLVKVEQAKLCGIDCENALLFAQNLMTEADLMKLGHKANNIASKYAVETPYDGTYRIDVHAKACIPGRLAMPTTNAAEVAMLITIVLAGENRPASAMYYAFKRAAKTRKGKLILEQLADIVKKNIPAERFNRRWEEN